MPELPEVEIQVRQLRRRLRGARIGSIDVRDRKISLPRRLVGQTIHHVSRRGKFIVFELDDGDCLLAHLRMTGWFEFERPANHRLAITTDRGTVYFQDPRRFGVIQMLTAREKDQRLTSLGPEPLARGFNLNGLQNTSRAIKLALLDQQLVAGIGNIYASESLWRARIHPRKRANRLRAGEREALRKGIIVAFRKAINYGPRIFAIQRFAVYERENKPCRRCGTRIRRIVQGQRSTYFCSQCQR